MVLVTTGDPDESGQLAQRQIEGVYTLDEAVNTLCQNVEVLDRAQKLADLKALVEMGEVQVNRPGTLDLTPIPLQARTFHEVAHWDSLNNNWISKYQFIDWRFPDPLERLRPDWSYWNCDYLSLQDAICLSANITPDWAKYTKNIGRRNVLKINTELQRLPNALNWAQSLDCLWRYDNPSKFEATNQVKLCEFARWVVKEKPDWVIPSEFKALARLGEVLIQQGSKRKKGRPTKLTQDKVAKLIQMQIDNPTLSHQSLGDEFGVSRTQVGKLLRNNGIN
jgi:hypothetical protein